MVEIRSNKGDFFVFDPETELISMNGVIVPYSEFHPVYVRNGISESMPPIFAGILDVKNNVMISTNGKVNKLINNDNDIDL